MLNEKCDCKAEMLYTAISSHGSCSHALCLCMAKQNRRSRIAKLRMYARFDCVCEACAGRPMAASFAKC